MEAHLAIPPWSPPSKAAAGFERRLAYSPIDLGSGSTRVGSVYLVPATAPDQWVAYNASAGGLAMVDLPTRQRILDQDFPTGGLEAQFFGLDQSVPFVSTRYLMTSIELTTACNLRCPYCYQANWPTSKLVSPETIDRTARYVADSVLRGPYEWAEVEFIGGEPSWGSTGSWPSLLRCVPRRSRFEP